MAFMVAAYLVIWLAAFAFILSMVVRQRKIDQELATLEQVAGEHDTFD